MSSAVDIWQSALGELELQISRPNFRTWLEKTTGLDYHGNEFSIGVPNVFVAEYLDKNQRSLIEKTLIGLTHPDIKINFKISSSGVSGAEVEALAGVGASDKKRVPRLNPRCTFDSFIVGGCNRLAHAGALSAAQKPGKNYNPLFIHGGVGLGKTHMLQAIGNMARLGGQQVIYISCEQFTRDFVKAVRNNQIDEFRNYYHGADLLLVDDIHFIAGKAATEECFFHTFNELRDSGRQIVLSSNCPPDDILDIGDRLRSRFKWGLSAEIKAPSLKTRLAILTSKAAQNGLEIDEESVDYIARHIKKNIREMEGGLNRVNAYSQLMRSSITLDITRQALGDIGRLHPPAAGEGSVVDAVAQSYSFNVEDLTGRRRDKETSQARQVAIYLLKQQNSCSLAEIGKMLGGRSPSTVSHSFEKITQDIENDVLLKRKVLEIKKRLT